MLLDRFGQVFDGVQLGALCPVQPLLESSRTLLGIIAAVSINVA